MIKSPRGTRDLLPPDTALWNFVENTVRDVFRAYNFQEIRTPILESTELFARGVGEETDIVSKEMFTWEDSRGWWPTDTVAKNLDDLYSKIKAGSGAIEQIDIWKTALALGGKGQS